jgi:acyl carrier protein
MSTHEGITPDHSGPEAYPLRRYPAEVRRAGARLKRGRGDHHTLRTFLVGVLAHHAPVEAGPLLEKPKDSLRLRQDLGIDSLSLIEVVFLVEESLRVSVPPESLRQLETIGQVMGLVASELRLPIPKAEKGGSSLFFADGKDVVAG